MVDFVHKVVFFKPFHDPPGFPPPERSGSPPTRHTLAGVDLRPGVDSVADSHE